MGMGVSASSSSSAAHPPAPSLDNRTALTSDLLAQHRTLGPPMGTVDSAVRSDRVLPPPPPMHTEDTISPVTPMIPVSLSDTDSPMPNFDSPANRNSPAPRMAEPVTPNMQQRGPTYPAEVAGDSIERVPTGVHILGAANVKPDQTKRKIEVVPIKAGSAWYEVDTERAEAGKHKNIGSLCPAMFRPAVWKKSVHGYLLQWQVVV